MRFISSFIMSVSLVSGDESLYSGGLSAVKLPGVTATRLLVALTGNPPAIRVVGEPLIFRHPALVFRLCFYADLVV